jgi:hypothetical protein
MSPRVKTCNIIKPILEKFPDQNLDVFTFLKNRMNVFESQVLGKRLASGVEGCRGRGYFIREMVDAKGNGTSFCKLRRYCTWHSN